MNQPTDDFVLIKLTKSLIDRAYKYLTRPSLSLLGDIDSSPAPKSTELVHTLTIHNYLPPEILVEIFNCLSFKDLCRIERVCKQWRELSKHVWLMKRRFTILLRSACHQVSQHSHRWLWRLFLKRAETKHRDQHSPQLPTHRRGQPQISNQASRQAGRGFVCSLY
jgi:hypothetical protein